jgi:predicted nuclease with TOPRIM domain
MAEESKLLKKLEEKQSEVKFNEEELGEVKQIQQDYMSVQNQFGQLKMAQLRLDQQQDSLLEENEKLEKTLKDVQDKERKFLDGITEKYGQGTLNPETGVFTPIESQNKS